MNELEPKIETVLFLSGGPVALKKIAGIVESSEEDVLAAIKTLKERLDSSSSGLRVIEVDGAFQLVTDPRLASLAQKMVKDELAEDLTPAALETLSLIAYIGPVAKSAIEYIRGVNSSFTIRNLLIRGLIERSVHPQKTNTYLYRPSADLIRHLGISSVEELPDFDKFKELKKNLEKNEA